MHNLIITPTLCGNSAELTIKCDINGCSFPQLIIDSTISVQELAALSDTHKSLALEAIGNRALLHPLQAEMQVGELQSPGWE